MFKSKQEAKSSIYIYCVKIIYVNFSATMSVISTTNNKNEVFFKVTVLLWCMYTNIKQFGVNKIFFFFFF